jgi:hypothetical protein
LATNHGGGVWAGNLNNCTVVTNYAGDGGGGVSETWCHLWEIAITWC